jgi:hypothetical protein
MSCSLVGVVVEPVGGVEGAVEVNYAASKLLTRR